MCPLFFAHETILQLSPLKFACVVGCCFLRRAVYYATSSFVLCQCGLCSRVKCCVFVWSVVLWCCRCALDLLVCCALIELRFGLRSVIEVRAVVAAKLRMCHQTFVTHSFSSFFGFLSLQVARWRPTAAKPLAGHLATKLRRGMVALMVALCGALHGGTATHMA